MVDLGKQNVLGVLIDAVDREVAVERVLAAARSASSYGVSALAVHGVMAAVRDESLRRRVNELELVVPDGQPVRWALNMLHGTKLDASVRGTDLALAVLRRTAEEGLPAFFYGSRREVLEAIVARLAREFPSLPIAGSEPSLFRAATRDEQDAIAVRIRRSGARILFVGLGCPRQELFVHAMRESLGIPALAIGAAFEYLGGTLREPPVVVRRYALEWAWRLGLEPRRLWRRYLLLNPAYLTLLALQRAGLFRPPVDVGGMEPPSLLAA